MREDISKILIKWGMPTRQAAIGEMIGYFKKLFGGCEICYGKGYSTQIVQYSESDGFKKYSEQEILFCKCSRGKQLQKEFKKEQKRLANAICALIDNIEFQARDTSLEEWKEFKNIRNRIRDQYVLNK